jgi:hypothetical protein
LALALPGADGSCAVPATWKAFRMEAQGPWTLATMPPCASLQVQFEHGQKAPNNSLES